MDQGLDVGDHAALADQIDPTTHVLVASPSPGIIALQPNHSAADPRLRALFADARVRLALSHLLDREVLNALDYAGLLTPRQLAPVARGPHAYPEFASHAIAHDLDLANRLLDEAGYAARDADGTRLHADGEPISLTILEIEGRTEPSPQALRIAEYLRDGGLGCGCLSVNRAGFVRRWGTNTWDLLYSRIELPVILSSTGAAFWSGGSPFTHWQGLYRAGDAGEPFIPAPEGHLLRELAALQEAFRLSTTEEERAQHLRAMLEVWRRELPAIGVLGDVPRLLVARRGLRGLDADLLFADETGGLGLQPLSQLYWGPA